MNNELDKSLVEKYPLIFRDRHADMKVTAMCWGFECDDGWYWLIDNLCESIQSYIDNNKPNKVNQIVAVQVKEKYGGLRFYYDGGNDFISGMVRLAENLSYKTCEICGSTKNITQTDGWIRTLCNSCLREGSNDQDEYTALINELLNDEEKLTKFFRDMGMHDKDGNLTKNYGGNETTVSN